MQSNPKYSWGLEEASLVWFYEISEITVMRVPRFTNSENFEKYVLISKKLAQYSTFNPKGPK